MRLIIFLVTKKSMIVNNSSWIRRLIPVQSITQTIYIDTILGQIVGLGLEKGRMSLGLC